jgi:hypothetical protein
MQVMCVVRSSDVQVLWDRYHRARTVVRAWMLGQTCARTSTAMRSLAQVRHLNRKELSQTAKAKRQQHA